MTPGRHVGSQTKRRPWWRIGKPWIRLRQRCPYLTFFLRILNDTFNLLCCLYIHEMYTFPFLLLPIIPSRDREGNDQGRGDGHFVDGCIRKEEPRHRSWDQVWYDRQGSEGTQIRSYPEERRGTGDWSGKSYWDRIHDDGLLRLKYSESGRGYGLRSHQGGTYSGFE